MASPLSFCLSVASDTVGHIWTRTDPLPMCLPRGGPYRCLLRLPVLWLCACHCEAPTPPEPHHHTSHCQDDRRGTCLTLTQQGNGILGLCVVGPGELVLSWSSCFVRALRAGFAPGTPTHAFRVPCALQVSKSACVLTTQAIVRLLKSKEAVAAVDVRTWPTILDTGTGPQHLSVCTGSCQNEPPFPFFDVGITLLLARNKLDKSSFSKW